MYDWFKVFNLEEFEDLDLVSKEYEYLFEDYGLKTILVTKGNMTSVLFDDVFLMIDLNGNNPMSMDDRAVYVDSNDDVWVGISI